MAQTEERFDPLLMAVLSRRIEAIIREMSNTVMRASRSAVITNARDMSCGILTYDHRLISVEEAMPIHVSALELTTRPITELFDDVKEGDAFFNNSPYHGVTHHADMTLCVPVFAEGEPLFWVLSRSHHADVGAPQPTTYLPYAATLYQEGVHFPCVRIQENREDKADIVRIGLQKIRAPNVWYGDYRAQVGACRNGERRLRALVEHYGIETVRAFVEAWMDYGARRAAAAIRELPAGTWRYTCTHDPIPGVAEEGIPITAQVTIEPEEGFITVDLRDNPDCVPGGVNLSEACAAGSCRIGVFYNLDPTIPHNDGSASRIKVLLRDGCVVGRPTFPVGTSVATTNVNDRLINAVQCCFAQIGAPHGLAEGGGNFSAGLGVISGIDDRDGTDVPFVNQFCTGLSGGPGTHGHDGWLTYEAPDGGGVLVLASIEIDEAQYPILMEERRIARDTMGARPLERRTGDPGRLSLARGPNLGLLLQRRRSEPGPGRPRRQAGRPVPQPQARGGRQLPHPPLLPRRTAYAGRGDPLPHRGGRRLRRPGRTRPRCSRRGRRPRLAQPRERAQHLQGCAGPRRQRHRCRGRRGEDAPAPGLSAARRGDVCAAFCQDARLIGSGAQEKVA